MKLLQRADAVKNPQKITVQWQCEAKGCGNKNVRKISQNQIIIDDTCDYCENPKVVHEPLTIRTKVNNER